MSIRRLPRWRALAAFVLAASSLGAAAHDEGASDAAGELGFFDCEHPPANIVTALPAPLGEWAQIECNAAGQKLIAAKGWQWRYPASWVTRPEAPAWSPEASFKLPGPKHFVKLDMATLDTAALDAAHAKLLSESATYRFHVETRPSAMYQLTAVNNLGHTMDIYFPVVSSDRLWAILCVPQCRSEYAFIIERAPR